MKPKTWQITVPFILTCLLLALGGQLIAAPPSSIVNPQSSIVNAPTSTYNAPTQHWLALPSPDGRYLFLGGQHGPFSLIDLASGAVVAHFPAPAGDSDGFTHRAAFSPDGRFLGGVSYSAGTNAWVLDAATGNLLHTLAPTQIYDLAFSPDSTYLLYGSFWGGGSSSVRRLLHTSDWSVARDFGNSWGVQSVAYAPDGQSVAFHMDSPAGVNVFNPADGSLISAQPGILVSGGKIHYAADSSELFIPLRGATTPATLRYDVATGAINGGLTAGLGDGLRGATLSAAGALLLYGDTMQPNPLPEYSALLLDPATGALQHQLALPSVTPGFSLPVRDAAFSPDGGQILLVNYGESRAALLDSTDGHVLRQFALSSNLYAAAFSANGQIIALADNLGRIHLYHALSGSLLRVIQHDLVGVTVYDLAFSPDSRELAAANGRYLYTFDVSSGQQTGSWQCCIAGPIATGHAILSLAYAPDGSQLAYSDSNDTLTIRQTSHGALLREQIGLHDGAVFRVVYSADGASLLTGGQDGQAKVWDAASGDLLLATAGSASAAVTWAAFDPTGQFIYTAGAFREGYNAQWGSYDYRVRQWDVANVLPNGRSPITPILPDTTYDSNVAANGWADFVLEAAPGQSLLVTATATTGDDLRLYGRYANQPTLALADWRALAPTARGDYALLIPATAAGATYFALYGANPESTPAPFTLRASYVSRYLADVTPTAVGNAGFATLNVTGLGFVDGLAVTLCAGGTAVASANPVTLQDSSHLNARFDLMGVASGAYDLCLTWPDAERHTLPAAVSVSAGSGGELVSDLIAPANVRRNRPYALSLTYGNGGDADLAAPLFIVQGSSQAQFKTECSADWSAGPVQLLGTASSVRCGTASVRCGTASVRCGTASVLPPGQMEQTAVAFQVIEPTPQINFALEMLPPLDTAVNWPTYRDGMRPPAYTAAEWNALFPALTARLGDTWADYLAVLAANADRLAARGVPSRCVPELINLEARAAQGLPTAAIAGQLRHAVTGEPILGAALVAYAYDGPTLLAARVGLTSWVDGRFHIPNLPPGDYGLQLKGYSFTTPLTLTIANDQDVTGLSLFAQPESLPPDMPDAPTPTANHSPVLTVDDQGQVVMLWSRANALWSARYDAALDEWADALPLPDAQGSDPALDFGLTVNHGSPGLAAAWRNGAGNDGRILYAIAQQEADGSYTWSQPITLTAEMGDSQPAIATTPADPLVLWLQQDWAAADDSDVYYALAAVPTDLLFDPDAPLADMLQDAVFFLPEAAQALYEQSLTIAIKQEKEIPAAIPVIGGKYKFNLYVTASGEDGCEEATRGGTLQTEIQLSERVAVTGSGTASAKWQNDTAVCHYAFTEASLSAGLGLTGKIPAYVFTLFKVVQVEAGAQIQGSLNGEVTWSAGSSLGLLPDGGQVTITPGMGVYGTAKFKGVEANLTATTDVTFKYQPPLALAYQSLCVNASAEISYSIFKYTISGKFGPNCTALAAALRQIEDAQTRVEEIHRLADGLPIEEVMVSQVVTPVPGSTAVYMDGTLLLPAVGRLPQTPAASDEVRDGAPALARSTNGEILAAWEQDSWDWGTAVGTSVRVMVYNNGSWSAATTIHDATAFNRDVAAAYVTADAPLVVWSRADAAGISLSSSITEALDALAASDIYYSVRSGGGWSYPAPVAMVGGEDGQPQVAGDGSGNALLAWAHLDSTADHTLYAAFWNGASWSVPQVIAKPTGTIQQIAVSYALSGTQPIPLLAWAQDVDRDVTVGNDTAVYFTTYRANAWAAPQMMADLGFGISESQPTNQLSHQPTILPRPIV